MNANETLTIRYQVNLPAAPGGTPRVLTNEARASATFGGSQFNPTDTVDVVQTDATLFKASVDDGSPQPGDLITYTLYVRNIGAVAENNVIVTDAVPADTTFVAARSPEKGRSRAAARARTCSPRTRSAGGRGRRDGGAGAGTAIAGTTLTFSGNVATATTPAAHNWASGVPVTIAGAGVPYNGTYFVTVTGANTFTFTMGSTPAANSSGTATGPYRLSFQVRINPGVADGTFIPNRGGYESQQTPYFLSNQVNPRVVGPALDVLKWSEPQTVRTVTSLTRTGTTATVSTAPIAHGWITGEVIAIAGASPAGYNGNHAITVTGANTFTYTVANTLTTPATGTITATGPTVIGYPNQVITFHVRARNTGTGTATNVRIDDTIPANTTYVAGSMAFSLNSSAYTALTDAGDLDQGTVPTAIALTGITQAAGTATATSAAAHGLSVGQIIEIAGATVAAYNGSYVITGVPTATTFQYAVPAGTTSPAGGGAITATRPRFVFASLGPGEDIDLRFQVTINPGTAGLSIHNQATVSTTELPPRDTNLVTIPIVGTVTVTGHVWLDLNDNQADPGAGEPDIANVNVVITDVNGNVQIVTTDANGNWSAFVPAGLTTANVDETDPDFPAGATETNGARRRTGTDGAVPARPSGTWATSQPPVVITEALERPAARCFPGQRVAYTVTVTNASAVAQADLNLADVLPPGNDARPRHGRCRVPRDSSAPRDRVLPGQCGCRLMHTGRHRLRRDSLHPDAEPESGSQLLRHRPGLRGRQRRPWAQLRLRGPPGRSRGHGRPGGRWREPDPIQSRHRRDGLAGSGHRRGVHRGELRHRSQWLPASRRPASGRTLTASSRAPIP